MAERKMGSLTYKDVDCKNLHKLSDKLIKTFLDNITNDMAKLTWSNFSNRHVNGMFRVRTVLMNEQRERRFAAIQKEKQKQAANRANKMFWLNKWMHNLKAAPPTKIPMLVRGAAKAAASAHKAGSSTAIRAANSNPITPTKKSKIPIRCTPRVKLE